MRGCKCSRQAGLLLRFHNECMYASRCVLVWAGRINKAECMGSMLEQILPLPQEQWKTVFRYDSAQRRMFTHFPPWRWHCSPRCVVPLVAFVSNEIWKEPGSCMCACVHFNKVPAFKCACVHAGISVASSLEPLVSARLSIGQVDLWVLSDPNTDIRLSCFRQTPAIRALN